MAQLAVFQTVQLALLVAYKHGSDLSLHVFTFVVLQLSDLFCLEFQSSLSS